MGTASAPLSPASQILSQTLAATSNASGVASWTFPSPPNGFTWTGTLTCASAPIGAVFLATVGGVSWGDWGANSVYGPVQVLGAGSQQLVVTATNLTANTTYTLQWNGSSDPSDLVAAVWPDVNTSGLQATIAGIINANIVGGSLTSIGSITNPVSSNPLAPDADVINVGSLTFTPPTTVTFQNASEVDTYTGFLLTLDSWPAGWGANSGLRVTATNPTTKQVITLTNSFISSHGTAGLQFYFPMSVNAGDTFTIVGTVQNTSGIAGTLSWTISGFRQPPYQAVQSSPGQSLDVVPYGGTAEYSSNLLTLTNISLFAPIGQAIRVHSVAVYMTSAAAAITGVALFNDANSGNPICALDLTQGTSATHGGFAYLGGLLLMPATPTTGQAGIQLANFTNKTVNMVARYDLVQVPNIV